MLHGTEILSVLQALKAAILWHKSFLSRDVKAWGSGKLGAIEETSAEVSQNHGPHIAHGTWKENS